MTIRCCSEFSLSPSPCAILPSSASCVDFNIITLHFSRRVSPMEPVLRCEHVASDRALPPRPPAYSRSALTRPPFPVSSSLLSSSHFDDLGASWGASAAILAETHALDRSAAAARSAFRHVVEPRQHYVHPSIRHVATAWAHETGRRRFPLYHETTDKGGVSPFPAVERAIDARRFWRYTDYLTRRG